MLSCLFSWWPAVVAAFSSSEGGLAGFGPFVAAVVVLALTQGRSGVKALLASMIKWRVPPRAYLAAIGIPIGITALAILLTIATGAAMPSAAALGAWTEIPLMVALMLLIPGMGGAWEEPGFRGFALGRLEQRFGLSAAPLLLGAFWVVWHLPLFLTGAILPTDVVVIMAVSVVIAAVYHSAPGQRADRDAPARHEQRRRRRVRQPAVHRSGCRPSRPVRGGGLGAARHGGDDQPTRTFRCPKGLIRRDRDRYGDRHPR